MIEMDEPGEHGCVRVLGEAEIADVAGASISLYTYLKRLAWQMQNAPADSTLIGCSDDMSTCSYQSN